MDSAEKMGNAQKEGAEEPHDETEGEGDCGDEIVGGAPLALPPKTEAKTEDAEKHH